MTYFSHVTRRSRFGPILILCNNGGEKKQCKDKAQGARGRQTLIKVVVFSSCSSFFPCSVFLPASTIAPLLYLYLYIRPPARQYFPLPSSSFLRFVPTLFFFLLRSNQNRTLSFLVKMSHPSPRILLPLSIEEMWTQTEPKLSSFSCTLPVTRLKLVSIYHTSDGVASRGHFFYFNQELRVVIRPFIHNQVPTVMVFYCISLWIPHSMWDLLGDLSLSLSLPLPISTFSTLSCIRGVTFLSGTSYKVHKAVIYYFV